MKTLWWWVAGLGTAVALGQLARWRRYAAPADRIDLNTVTREQLLQMAGMDVDTAERILDNRPYRSKFDLLNRLVVPQDLYNRWRHRLYVDEKTAHRAISIA